MNNTALFRWVNGEQRTPSNKKPCLIKTRLGDYWDAYFKNGSWYKKQTNFHITNNSINLTWLEEYTSEVQEEEIIDRERKAFAEGIGIGINAQKSIVKDVENSELQPEKLTTVWQGAKYSIVHLHCRHYHLQIFDMQHYIYTHKTVKFEYDGKLNIRLPHSFAYLKKQLNNGVLSWRLNRTTWLSIKQLKKLLNSLLP